MIGIDEADVMADQLSGRFFSAVLSQYYHKRDDKVIPVGDRVLFIQVISNVPSRPFMMYLADMLNKTVIPSEIKREYKYALYWADQADLDGTANKPMEGTAGKPMGELICEYLKSVLNNP
jgi:hypothetical protein